MQAIVRRSVDNPNPVVGIAGIGGEDPVVVRTMPIWQQILIRAARVYFVSFSSLLGGDGVGLDEVLGVDLSVLGPTLLVAAKLAVGPSVGSLIMNVTEFLLKVDAKNPGWRA